MVEVNTEFQQTCNTKTKNLKIKFPGVGIGIGIAFLHLTCRSEFPIDNYRQPSTFEPCFLLQDLQFQPPPVCAVVSTNFNMYKSDKENGTKHI
jgi:hypothetical protein